jgi:hypothetical protein
MPYHKHNKLVQGPCCKGMEAEACHMYSCTRLIPTRVPPEAGERCQV